MPKYQIPTQSKFISTSTVFTGTFNVPTLGSYDFKVAGNTDIPIVELNTGHVYFIERMSVGGNITEDQFLESIVTFPQLYVKKSISKEIVYQKPIPIVNYSDGLECSVFVHSDKKNDFLTLSLEGLLTQLPSMVGINAVKLQVSFSMYAIGSAYFNAAFRDVQNISIGQVNRS